MEAGKKTMIISCYSFKGGTGRSMALANLAEIFYEAGLKVLVVDWDLEAPGVDRFFDPKNTFKAKEGLANLLISVEKLYKKELEMLGYEAKPENVAEISIDNVLTSDDLGNKLKILSRKIPDKMDNIHIITAGKRLNFFNYAKSIIESKWSDFLPKKDKTGITFFDMLRVSLTNLQM
ncbi:MAG: AAA family ATPase [Desulfobacteraceae bacterium]|nr:AAA family ATPase [Desulfobacteraceae bacterium]